MLKIIKATIEDAETLSKVGPASFLPAHGHSAPKEIIDSYIAANFSEENLIKELSNPNFQYHIVYYNNKIAGFSKVIFNFENENIKDKKVTKMERLYLLKEFYNLGLGKKLLDFNINLAQKHKQAGIWLFVWIENQRALSFYKKTGFKKVGYFDFVLSPTRTNPNDVLYLAF